MPEPVWITVCILLLFGVLAVARLASLLVRDARGAASEMNAGVLALRAGAATLERQVRLLADRTARLTGRRRQV